MGRTYHGLIAWCCGAATRNIDNTVSVKCRRVGAEVPPALFLVGTVQKPNGSAVRVAWSDDTAARRDGPEGRERPSPALLPGARRLALWHLLWRGMVRPHRQQHQLGAITLDVSTRGSAGRRRV